MHFRSLAVIRRLPTFGRPSAAGHAQARQCRAGLSLMELLIATMLSIMVMGAVVSLFGYVGDNIAAGRARIDLDDRLRSAVERLRSDLHGMTVDTTPWQSAAAGGGYLEIDKRPPTPTNQSFNGLIGYTQDVLTFTTRAKDLPFSARAIVNGQTTTIESQIAEVQWFVSPKLDSAGKPVTNPPLFSLYRHMLLVRPDFGVIPLQKYINFDSASVGTLNYDISAHQLVDGPQASAFATNTLADLTYREFRFNHSPAPYPFSLYPGFPGPVPQNDPRYGEDVVLDNVINFDIKVWDPLCEVRQDANGTPLVPSDPGYNEGNSLNPKSYGAYVDLNYANNPNRSYFSGPYYGLGQKSSLANNQLSYGTYDTWSDGCEYYNHSPYSFFGDPTHDVIYGQTPSSASGFDTDGANGVGDPLERRTSPPYPVPLRGLQIKIRVYEPGTRQVREVTFTENFVPD